jgi:hypothetical protein
LTRGGGRVLVRSIEKLSVAKDTIKPPRPQLSPPPRWTPWSTVSSVSTKQLRSPNSRTWRAHWTDCSTTPALGDSSTRLPSCEERASAAAEAQAAQGYRERGFTVLPERPESWDEACIPLHHLMTADGCRSDDQVVTDPAHWAVLLYEDTALCDVETGELIDEDLVDWQTEDRPDATPAEGLRHAASVTEATVFVPEYFCLDYRAAALTAETWFARNAGMVDTDGDATVDHDDEARQGPARRPKPNGPRPKSGSAERSWCSTSSATPR